MKAILVALVVSVLTGISFSTPQGPRPVEVVDLELRYNYDRDIFALQSEHQDSLLPDPRSSQDELPEELNNFLDLADKPAKVQEHSEGAESPFGLRRPHWPPHHGPPHHGPPHHGPPHHRPSRPPHTHPTGPPRPSTLPEVSATEEPIGTTGAAEGDTSPPEPNTTAPAEPTTEE